jgi:5-methylcytosine-specific restriction endonuclease McrA
MPIRPTLFNPARARQPRNWIKTGAPQERLSGRALQERNKRIKVRDRFHCKNKQCNLITDQLQVDHKVAIAHGGLDVDDNLQSLCDCCHRVKSAIESSGRRLPDPSNFPLTLKQAKRRAVKADEFVGEGDDDEWGDVLSMIDRSANANDSR